MCMKAMKGVVASPGLHAGQVKEGGSLKVSDVLAEIKAGKGPAQPAGQGCAKTGGRA